MTTQLLNADFTQRIVIATARLPWIASPQPGVERRMLDRIGGEVARATSLVRYAPASTFPAHDHAQGEEFLVLDGVFSDEAGDYPAGTYVRNPPGSRHTPRTGPGCIIFVKLRQMLGGETLRVVIDTAATPWPPADAHGLSRLPLYADDSGETVALEQLVSGGHLAAYHVSSGEEIYLLRGDLADEHGAYDPGTWIRNPAGFRHELMTVGGAVYWVKRGHLPPRT
jgi:anti-sigma factor ChrR (cupin superfamily)